MTVGDGGRPRCSSPPSSHHTRPQRFPNVSQVSLHRRTISTCPVDPLSLGSVDSHRKKKKRRGLKTHRTTHSLPLALDCPNSMRTLTSLNAVLGTPSSSSTSRRIFFIATTVLVLSCKGSHGEWSQLRSPCFPRGAGTRRSRAPDPFRRRARLARWQGNSSYLDALVL